MNGDADELHALFMDLVRVVDLLTRRPGDPRIRPSRLTQALARCANSTPTCRCHNRELADRLMLEKQHGQPDGRRSRATRAWSSASATRRTGAPTGCGYTDAGRALHARIAAMTTAPSSIIATAALTETESTGPVGRAARTDPRGARRRCRRLARRDRLGSRFSAGEPLRPRQNRLIISSAASSTSASPLLTRVATASPAPTSATAIMWKSVSGSGCRVPASSSRATMSMIFSRPSRTVCANA